MMLAAVASGLGALARYGLAGAVQRRTAGTRPWGTAVVNVTGAILLGLLTGPYAAGRVDAVVFTVAGQGCSGGTTCSTWMVESVRLGVGCGRRAARSRRQRAGVAGCRPERRRRGTMDRASRLTGRLTGNGRRTGLDVTGGPGTTVDCRPKSGRVSLARAGCQWTVSPCSTRKRSEVRILYAPPPWPPESTSGGHCIDSSFR